jgi:hypothetical protein
MLTVPLAGIALIGSTGLFALGLACGSASTRHAVVAQDDDEESQSVSVDMTKVPAEVQTAAKKYFGALDGCKASREDDEGDVTYEIEGKAADGMGLDLKISANGQIAEVEREIKADALPAAGRANLEKQFPGAKTVKVEAVEMHYFSVKLDQGGKHKEVAIGASGRVFDDEEGEEGEGGEEAEEHEKH